MKSVIGDRSDSNDPDFADDVEAAEAARRLTEGHLWAIRKAPEGQ